MFSVGAYVFDARVGKGAFSCVVRGRHTANGTPVVAKLEPKDSSAETPVLLLQEEAGVLQSLQHIGSVPRLFAHEVTGDYRVLVMSCHGRDLGTVYKHQPGLFTFDVCAHVFANVLETLAMVHETGLVHSDVKPDNILESADPAVGLRQLTLCDFGVARYWRAANGKHIELRERVRKSGSPRYMSPFVQSEQSSSRRDDLYSLFYTVLHLFLGTLPWDDGTSKRRDEEIVNEKKRLLAHTCMASAPKGLKDVYVEVSAIEFAERPDYAKLCELIRSA